MAKVRAQQRQSKSDILYRRALLCITIVSPVAVYLAVSSTSKPENSSDYLYSSDSWQSGLSSPATR